MYDQLFRNIILRDTEEDMQDMCEFCETQYQDNPREQKFLRLLKTAYSSHTPAWWYTQDSFIYRMMNKAIRTHQYDTLYVLRVFIRHLHQQLVEEHKKQGDPPNILFRGQVLDNEDFEKMRENEGGLLCISHFFSTSSDREVAYDFARGSIQNRKKASILMEITVDKNTTVPIASISELGVFKNEKEWLFSMGSVFRMGSLVRSPDGIWILKLTLTDDYDQQLNDLKNYFAKSMEDSNNCLNFGKLMHELASWKKSEYFYLKALQTETALQRRSVLLNNLGLVKGEMEQNDEALAYLHLSLELKEAAEQSDAAGKAASYNNIATLYYKQSKMTEAIEYFQKAIEACQSQTNKNEELVATLYANMAMIYNDQGKHQEALKNNQESLNIRLKLFPKIHPTIASAYSNMASTLNHMGSHAEAIKYAQKAVDIDKKALPSNHPQTLLHIHNLEIFKQNHQD
jgi:Tfp pilus assembly protein PilF